MNGQLAALERLRKVLAQAEPSHRCLAHVRRVHRAPPLAESLRRMHRHVGVADRLFRAALGVIREGDSNAGGRRYRLTAQQQRLAKPADEPRHVRLDRLARPAVEDERELVAA